MLLGLLGWCLLIAVVLYTLMLSALAFPNQPTRERYGRLFKPILSVVGMIFWSGFLAMAYVLLYFLVFDREIFFLD